MKQKTINTLNEAHGENWSIYNADCVDFASQMPDNSIDLTVYSPPFANLYVYGDSVADMGNNSDQPWIVWCESNQESDLLRKAIPDAVEVKGSDSADSKEKNLVAFTDGDVRVLVSKSRICGFGMNWQHCRNMAFASISYSYEKFYQAIRRSWRFGQTEQVNVHVIIADAEIPVWRAVESKALDHKEMKDHMKYAVFSKGEKSEIKIDYNPTHKATLPAWL